MQLPTKILLLSADESTANSICSCLTRAGYKLIYVNHGIGAIDLIRLEKPALILLDINLSDFNSLAIIRSIRSDGSLDKIPVILMGSNIKEADVLVGLEVGADLCLVEMFHPQLFVARIRSLLRRSELVKFP
jgi:DNA-binding response OmpR family regulator